MFSEAFERWFDTFFWM